MLVIFLWEQIFNYLSWTFSFRFSFYERNIFKVTLNFGHLVFMGATLLNIQVGLWKVSFYGSNIFKVILDFGNLVFMGGIFSNIQGDIGL